MLAAYHLFRDPGRVASTPLVRELLEATGRPSLPQAKVAVLDGAGIVAGAPEKMADGTEVHTLLGQLTYRLGGAEAYAEIADQDRDQLGSGTAQLVGLLERQAPCLILLDETLEYLNKALSVSVGEGNLAATTLTLVKELCTAASNVPGVAVLATLTSSRLEDYATLAGEEMQERLSKVVGRTENIVTPVEGDDIFPILHRRLFSTIGEQSQREAVVRAYVDYYESLGDVLPPAVRDADYRERLASAYPIHPELVDILTNRWGSLSGFQRTRGALRTLAHIVKALAQRATKAPLIHAADVDLADAGIRAEVIRFAGESYKAALNTDIIRPDSRAPAEDRRRGGQAEALRLGTGLATTAFLHSFGADKVVGASGAQMLLGVGRPGLSRGLVEDIRDALESSAWYMRLEGGRYRFTTEPNLNKAVMDREGAIGEERVRQMMRETIATVAGSGGVLKVVPRVEESADLPDEQTLTLGVLDQNLRIGPETRAETSALAERILTERGGVFRANQNSAMLIAADDAAMRKARASTRNLAALRDLNGDHHRLGRFNKEQRDQLTRRLAGAEVRVSQQIVMAYRHLLLMGARQNGPDVELIDLGPARVDVDLAGRALEFLRGADRIAERGLAAAALLSERFGVLAAGQEAVELDRLLSYFYRLPRLPKLASAQVLRASLAEGVAPDAVLRFREEVSEDEIHFQPGTWLVRSAAIAPLVEARRPAGTDEKGGPPPPEEDDGRPAEEPAPGGRLGALRVEIADVESTKARELVKTAVLPLARSYSEVNLDVTIRAEGGEGLSSSDLDLTVLEGLRQLGLDKVEVGGGEQQRRGTEHGEGDRFALRRERLDGLIDQTLEHLGLSRADVERQNRSIEIADVVDAFDGPNTRDDRDAARAIAWFAYLLFAAGGGAERPDGFVDKSVVVQAVDGPASGRSVVVGLFHEDAPFLCVSDSAKDPEALLRQDDSGFEASVAALSGLAEALLAEANRLVPAARAAARAPAQP
jgi:hypothetical protein